MQAFMNYLSTRYRIILEVPPKVLVVLVLTINLGCS